MASKSLRFCWSRSMLRANFATVDEVEAALKNLAIIAKAPSPEMGVASLHWMIADAKRSIVVECQADGMHVYDDPVDMLTNQPPLSARARHAPLRGTPSPSNFVGPRFYLNLKLQAYADCRLGGDRISALRKPY